MVRFVRHPTKNADETEENRGKPSTPMRKIVQQQPSLVAPFIDHEHAEELRAMDAWLETIPSAAGLVYEDLVRDVRDPQKGRENALTADQVLRALLVMRMRNFTYEDLAFHLADSATYRTFCRLGLGESGPSVSALNRDFKKVRPETLETVNRMVLGTAADAGIEKARKVRVDCTVTETNIHQPSDSEQLWDCVRVLARGLRRGGELTEIDFVDHTRRAKRRRLGIRTAKNKKVRRQRYRDLLKITRKTIAAAERGAEVLKTYTAAEPLEMLAAWELADELLHFTGLARQVVDQAHRRVILGEKVPPEDKVLSIFEPHTDIIIKKRRETEFGHKLCLATGVSGLVLDLVVEEGNPADSSLSVRMVERQQEIYGRVPRQTALDGGFASRSNLADLKAKGVQDVCFSKGRGLKVTEMVKSSWVYRRLRNFRAGIEAGISFLKRCFGLRRCSWHSLPSFKAYAWASVVAANLLTLARYQLD